MNQPIKFPDMRPPMPPREIVPPPPSSYGHRIPAFPTSELGVKNRRGERKRLWFWFGVAVALHAALLIGIWLSPPLRIKWEPPPEAWVQVTSLAKSVPPPELVPPPAPRPNRAAVQIAGTKKPGGRHASGPRKPSGEIPPSNGPER